MATSQNVPFSLFPSIFLPVCRLLSPFWKALLHELQGIGFIRQLRLITERKEFYPLKTDPQVYIVGGESGEDYLPLLDAARKAVEHGYGIRSITDEIRHHFETSPSAVEVLIFTGNKEISIKRNIASSKGFLKMMMNSFRK